MRNPHPQGMSEAGVTLRHMSRPDPTGRAIVTIRMLTQLAYCERLFHLEFVEAQWDDNVYTDEGRFVHRRVDEHEGTLPDPSEHPDSPRTTRSVALESSVLGLRGVLDIVESREADGTSIASPVEMKRGSAPSEEREVHDSVRVQVMAQALLLREHGYRVDVGIVYFAESKTRRDIVLDEALEERTRHLIGVARKSLESDERPTMPPPLDDSPRCVGCSLSGICLPDETRLLADGVATLDSEIDDERVRRLFTPKDDAAPLYVQEQGSQVGKDGEGLYVSKQKTRLVRVHLKDISQLVTCGSVSLSYAALHMLCSANVPVLHMSMGHWFYGATTGAGPRNSYDRAAQFRKADDAAFCLTLAKAFVAAKIANQRTLLRRNGTASPGDLAELARAAESVEEQSDASSLLGIEGSAAAAYFRNFASMLRTKADDPMHAFDFHQRNRRPPRDPINALLSFAYAMLAKECVVACIGAGLDPHWGFFHRPRHGRPALALDLMEEFRPLIADSAVISAVNNNMLSPDDFVQSSSGCAMRDVARKALIRSFEARLEQLATHPLFGYRCSWRRIVALQARLLAKTLRGDTPRYIGVTTR